ncbi:MAG: LamG domain-containing protein, partial [Elusimicrobiota bacterium]
ADSLPTAERTTQAWFYTTDTSYGREILGYGGGGERQSWMIYLSPDKRTITVHGHYGGGLIIVHTVSASLTNAWHHIAVTTSQEGTKLYLDGSMIASNGLYVTSTNVAGKDAYIGAEPTGSGTGIYTDGTYQTWKGLIDEVAIYNRALSAEEIEVQYQFGLADKGYCSPPPVCGDGVQDSNEDCDEGAGNVAAADAVAGQCTTDCAIAACGDGVVNAGEDCDGTGVGDATCADYGFTSGSLSCGADCSIDSSSCDNCPSDVVGYWKLNEESGSIAPDSADSLYGAVTGAVWTAGGKAGGALSFDGSGDYVKMPADSLPTAERTTQAWFYTTDTSYGREILGYGGGGERQSWMIYLSPDKRTITVHGHYGGGLIIVHTVPASLTNAWHHIAVTTSQEGTKMYLDGSLIASNGLYVTSTQVAGKDAYIGAEPTGSGTGIYTDGTYQTWKGLLDEVAIYSRALSAEEIQQQYQKGLNGGGYCAPDSDGDGILDDTDACGNDSAPQGLVSYWGFEDGEGSTAADSFDGNPGTVNGATFGTGPVGGALSLDGNDWVDIPNSANWNIATNLSVEFWMKGSPSQPESQFLVIDKSHGWTDTSGWMFQGLTGGGILEWGFGSSSGWAPNARTTVSVVDDAWHHIVGTYDGNALRLYMDGALDDESFVSGYGEISPNSRVIEMGRSWCAGSGCRYFNGTLDEVAIYDSVLSAVDVEQHYQYGSAGKGYCEPSVCGNDDAEPGEACDGTDLAAETCASRMGIGYTGSLACAGDCASFDTSGCVAPPDSDGDGVSDSADACDNADAPQGLVSYWGFEAGSGNVAADSFDSNPGTVNGATWQAGQVGGALGFDGGDWVDIPESANWNIASNLSVEFWMKGAPGQPEGQFLVIDKSHGWTDTTGWSFQGITGGGILEWAFGSSSGWVSPARTSASVTDDAWHHIVGTYDGGFLRLYVDGALDDESDVSGSGTIAPNNRVIEMGRSWCGGGGCRYFAGALDEVAIHNRVLSAAEVQEHYQDGQADRGYCQPAPVCATPPSGMVSWWTGDGDATDFWDGNNGTLMNGAGFGDGKVSQAFSLDGTDDYVELPLGDNLPSGSEPFTLAMWVYPRNIGQQAFFTRGELGNNRLFALAHYPAGGGLRVNHYANDLQTSKTLENGRWYHLVVTYSGSVTKLYVDGANVGSRNSGAINLQNTFTRIGDYRDGFYGAFDGLIDEVSMYDRALSAAEIQTVHEAGSAGKCRPEPTCAPLPEGLISMWTGDGTAEDAGGYNDGTLVSGVGYGEGMVGQAFALNGSNYIRVENDPSLNPAHLTIMAWVKPMNTTHDIRTIVSKPAHMASWSHPYSMYNLRVREGDGANPVEFWSVTYGRQIFSTSGFPLGQWRFVVATYDGAEERIYVDGALEAAQAYTGPISPNDVPLMIGVRSPGAPGEYFNGMIDELALFDRAVSAADVQAIYAAGGLGMCRPEPTPKVQIASPSDGGTVRGPDVEFDFELDDWTVGGKGEGHILFYVDGDATPFMFYGGADQTVEYDGAPTSLAAWIDADTIRINGLSDGQHTVRSRLAGADHAPLDNPEADSSVSFNAYTPACAPRPEGLISLWSGEESADDSAGANNGALMNGAGFAAGMVGQAFSLDGSNDYVRIEDDPSLSPGSGITMMAWIKPLGSAHDIRTILSKAAHASWTHPYSVYNLRIWNGDGTNPVEFWASDYGWTLTSTSFFPLGQWRFVAATYDGAEERVYVDGNLERTRAVSGAINSSAQPLAIGTRNPSDMGELFNGLVDEVALFDRAVSAADIQAICMAGDLGMCEPADSTPPKIAIAEPADGSILQTSEVPVTVSYSDVAGMAGIPGLT